MKNHKSNNNYLIFNHLLLILIIIMITYGLIKSNNEKTIKILIVIISVLFIFICIRYLYFNLSNLIINNEKFIINYKLRNITETYTYNEVIAIKHTIRSKDPTIVTFIFSKNNQKIKLSYIPFCTPKEYIELIKKIEIENRKLIVKFLPSDSQIKLLYENRTTEVFRKFHKDTLYL